MLPSMCINPETLSALKEKLTFTPPTGDQIRWEHKRPDYCLYLTGIHIRGFKQVA